jgi:transcriptional regulator with XRE-family HTH domain
MTRAKLAELIGKDIKTLSNWEKANPELIRLINQGIALDEQIEEAEKHLEKLKEIKEQAAKGKLNLKTHKEH